MSVKTILVAHRVAAVRDRFAAALADARHAYVVASTAAAARTAVADETKPVSLALVDLGLSEDAIAFVRDLGTTARRPLPILVFSGSVEAASQIAALAALNVAGYMSEHASTPQILPALAPHLFPDSFNRRASRRVALGVPVSFRAGQSLTGAVTLDVSRGGLAIRTMSPLPPGTLIQLTMRLPATQEDIEAAGRVAWSDRKVGMGVQFERLSAAHQQLLEEFLDSNGG